MLTSYIPISFQGYSSTWLQVIYLSSINFFCTYLEAIAYKLYTYLSTCFIMHHFQNILYETKTGRIAEKYFILPKTAYSVQQNFHCNSKLKLKTQTHQNIHLSSIFRTYKIKVKTHNWNSKLINHKLNTFSLINTELINQQIHFYVFNISKKRNIGIFEE